MVGRDKWAELNCTIEVSGTPGQREMEEGKSTGTRILGKKFE
jgi:hypothetical protein